MIFCLSPDCSDVSGAAAGIWLELVAGGGIDFSDSGGTGTDGGPEGAKPWSGVSSGGGIDDWMVVEIIAPMSSPRPPTPTGESTGSIPVMTGAGGAKGMLVLGATNGVEAPSGSGMACGSGLAMRPSDALRATGASSTMSGL